MNGLHAQSGDDAPEEVSSRAVFSESVLGTGSALPARKVENDELAKLVDTSDEWIFERAGIRTRYIAGEGESTVQLGYEAARRAMSAAGVTAADIDLIVLATETPDQLLPSSAALLQQRLGVDGAMALDVRAACSGFLFALTIADSITKTHRFRRALVIGAETLSRMIDWSDRSTCVLFGDGAGAVVYSPAAPAVGRPTPGVLAVDLHTEGHKGDFICRPGGAFPPSTLPEEYCAFPARSGSAYVQMKGREVFKAAVTCMSDSVERVLEQSGYSVEDIDLFIPHQSNKRIIEGVCERVGFTDPSKVAVNIDRIANTSAASIPIALDEAARSGRIARGDLVLMTAVGAGMTYGSVLVRW